MARGIILLGVFLIHNVLQAKEIVYVETPLDTDNDGKRDRIYVEVTRPANGRALPTIFTITPYALGGGTSPFHNVEVKLLPQDENLLSPLSNTIPRFRNLPEDDLEVIRRGALERNYAQVNAHSIGTGYSSGCPTVGDVAETLATKAVIDWLNGREKAYTASGQEVTADWANGAVGMSGVSYNGTLPNMVATMGVDGLKAIIPIAAISNWYDYYRANGLVVGPGGYVGEDADVLGKFIVKKDSCEKEISEIATSMGREHGDYSKFWQERDYLPAAGQTKAAVFIMHGQSDWNVRQRHAIQWWESLEGVVPRRMWLHKGAHHKPQRPDFNTQYWAWFDRYVKGIRNGVEDEPAVEVEPPTGAWVKQSQWPNETTKTELFFLNANHSLSSFPESDKTEKFVDQGKKQKLEDLLKKPSEENPARLVFLTAPLETARLMSGTPKVQLSLSVLNRKAANITVAIVDYDANDVGKVITRGWADPQNYQDLTLGEKLIPGKQYDLSFEIEPKQFTFAKGHRIGVLVISTDYDHTLRPDVGTEITVAVGSKSSMELRLSAK